MAVRLVSAGVSALMIGISVALFRSGAGELGVVFPLLIPVGAVLFTIRGYELEGQELFVRRLLWSTRVDLSSLRKAWADPEAMRRSWRIFGNGGLFSISGLFRNKMLGSYRAFAMDPKRAVVLETADRRVIVTPDEPAGFLRGLRALGFAHVELVDEIE